MMYYTHLLFGLLAALAAIITIDIQYPTIFIVVTLFASLLPDMDDVRSKFGKKNLIMASILNTFFGHRGLIHTIYIPLLLFVLINLINFEIALAIFLGYLSHLLLDATTKQGIRLFYPLSKSRIKGPFKTNSFTEKVIALILLIANIYLFLNYI